MSDIIRLLPDSVANQIAAGEVIQRPASVIKELVENAVDAGADNIQVIIRDAGRTLIQVVDNGKGMSPMDARMAFERHATSKITEAADLFELHTMGFRGEALASIAAIAQVELLTMRPDDKVGTKLLISGSKLVSQEDAATVPGTNMMVKNLFFNVPARRKFLKKDSVEFSNIAHEFERLALVNPSVEMTLIHNDNVVHQLLRGSLKQRIGSLFGKGMERQLVPVATETSIVKIDGFVGLPSNARKRGALQYFFVNGRNMRHPYFHKAVMHCYEQLIRPDEQPNYFLNFTVDPTTIDVNIHPTKSEIKFENEQPIWQILVAAIKESLGKFNIVPSIDFDAVDVPDIPAFNPNSGVSNDFGPQGDYNPFETATNSSAGPFARASSAPSGKSFWQNESRAAVDNWEKLYESFRSDKDDFNETPKNDELIPSRINDIDTEPAYSDDSAAVSRIFQIGGRYIISQSRDGLIAVNQRRAHIRVLFERFRNFSSGNSIPSQSVMFPETISLTQSESSILESGIETATKVGFELSFLGDATWAINGVPSIDIKTSPQELLKAIIDDMSNGISESVENVNEQITLSLARASAVPYGKTMTASEMEHLLSELFSLSTPAMTPDGKRVYIELTADAIEGMF